MKFRRFSLVVLLILLRVELSNCREKDKNEETSETIVTPITQLTQKNVNTTSQMFSSTRPPTTSPGTTTELPRFITIANVSVNESQKATGEKIVDNKSIAGVSKKSDVDRSKEEDGEDEQQTQPNAKPEIEKTVDDVPTIKEEDKSNAAAPVDSNIDSPLKSVIVVDEPQNSHFMTVFLIITCIVAVSYVAFYKRKKIMGLLLEGRRGRTERNVRYKKLREGSDAEDNKGNVIY